jgi:hypothetical protein
MENQRDPQLAILIGAPHQNQSSMHYDLAAMYNALRQREMLTEDILWLEGKLDRHLLLGFFAAIGRRIAAWHQGTLLLYVTGHGFFTGECVEEARVGIELQPSEQLSSEYHIFWDELLQALALPAGVKLILLPDH